MAHLERTDISSVKVESAMTETDSHIRRRGLLRAVHLYAAAHNRVAGGCAQAKACTTQPAALSL